MNKQAISPKIEILKEEILKGNTRAMEEFWANVEQNGAPLVEAIEDDDENVLVTLIWRDKGDIETIAVLGEAFGLDTEENRLERLLDTDLWYRTSIINKKARSLYVFFINEKPDMELNEIDVRLDPLNKNINVCLDDEDNPGDYCVLFKSESMVELPGFEGNPYVEQRPDVKKGKIDFFRLQSELLENTRRIWVYTPAGYDSLTEPCGTVMFMDGWEYVHETKLPDILDNMIADGVIPPVCGIFVDNRTNRIEDLRLNTKYVDYLAKELMPWLRENYKVSDEAAKTLIGGFSAGGVTAGYAGFLYSDVFGKVLSQSGAFYWGIGEEVEDAALVDMYDKSPKLPIDVYMSLGEYEKFDAHLNANLRLYEVLKSKNYRVMYEEFFGGHTNFDCQLTLSKGLKFLLG